MCVVGAFSVHEMCFAPILPMIKKGYWVLFCIKFIFMVKKICILT